MTRSELLIELDAIIRKALESGADTETIERATIYTLRRIDEGKVKTLTELQACVAAFADGFCTGRGCRH